MTVYGPTGAVQTAAPHVVQGSVALSSGTASVTFTGSAAFSGSTHFVCSANDASNEVAIQVTNSSSGITLTGEDFGSDESDTVYYNCIGH